ncbi:MAG: hypothetical protein ACI8VT_002625 [Saprospiraceae bacterium]|jgi:hypothetical protein
MKKSSALKLLSPLIFLLLTMPMLFSQTDAHYWTHQFGAKGLLMNGAVIASTEDETAVFYNPGAMSGEDDFSLSLSFLTPSYSILKTENYLGKGNDVTDKNLGFAPGLGSMGFNPWKSKRVRMAITSFTRFKSNISFRGRAVDEVAESPNTLFIGNLEFSRKLSERWIGFGTSVKLTNFLSVGVSQFVTFHNENATFSIKKELVDKNNPNNLLLGWRNRLKYSFSSKGGLLTKFGVLLKAGKIKIGATLTTPTYGNSLSSASYEFDDLKTFGQDSTKLISNLNGAELKGYKTPLSVGFGMDFPLKKTHLSFSVEYFKGIDIYTLIEDTDDPFNGLAPGAPENTVLVKTGNRRVINFSIGGQTKLREKISLIWGFRTDFNQREISQDIKSLQFLSTTPNIYHFSIGNSLELWNSLISFGLDYGFGRKKDDTQLVDFSNINSENLFELTGNGSVVSRFQSLNFILAYDFRFKKKKKE